MAWKPKPGTLFWLSPQKSVVKNDEYFNDDTGNEFAIDIVSLNVGVDWQLTFYPDYENIVKNIRYKIKSTTPKGLGVIDKMNLRIYHENIIF